MKKNRNAFSLIEVLTVIAIIMILLILTVAVTTLTRKRAAVMTTRHTLAIIHQALIHYKEATGNFPKSIETSVMSALTKKNIEIKDYKGDVLKTVEAIFSETDLVSLIQEKIINEDRTVFLDGWGNPILYFYGEVKAETDPHPYTLKCVVENKDEDKKYNVNWVARHFDLISKGSDGASSESEKDIYTQKDDLTNFT
jgi:type II secretory pathway pseudopilin PulG